MVSTGFVSIGAAARVVVIEAFQMLCPGCVSHGLPLARKVHSTLADEVVVIGLHTVFEHHDVMGPKALRAFLSEYRIRFPVGIDQAAHDSSIPLTMRAYELQGTPSVVVFDGEGRVRFSRLGQVEDLHLGAVIGELLANVRVGETPGIASNVGGPSAASCGDDACVAGVTR